MKNSIAIAFALVCSALFAIPVFSQPLDVSSCASMVKRSNGNGQYGQAPGDFRPQSTQNNPVAGNVIGTSYQLVPFMPNVKTGDIHFKWTSATAINYVPVITRVWITAVGSTTPVLSNIKFGPPSAITPAAPLYYVDYCFYGNNLPNAGILTLEFADPQTGSPAFLCSYDLQANGSTTTQTVNCTPTITTQPASQTLCGASTATFSVVASGATGYQWQVSTDGTNFSNISNGGNYSNATTATLTISSPNSLDGKYYRVVLSATGCTSATSAAARLVSKPKPTAAFSTPTSLCGISSKSLGVTFTGTAPYSLSYSNGASTTTVNNITSNPYYFTVTPAAATTYTLTSVSDAYCSNSSLSGAIAVTVSAAPTITPSNASTCIGNNSFSLSYTSSGSPTKYSITAGPRSMTGFSAVSNATLTGSPISVTIPTSGFTAGVYDFNITVTNATTGCTSAIVPFTVTVNSLPVISASASRSSVCGGTAITVTAAPSTLSSYSWTASPSATISSVYNPTVTPTANTTYTVTGTDANGCSANASTSVTVLSNPTVTISPSSASICGGQSVLLNASGANSYSWSPSTGLSATSGNSVIATPASTTTYTVTSQNATGCPSTATVTVTVSTPVVSIAPSSNTICAGNSASLTASGASTYSWTPTTGLSATTGATVTATPTGTTTYRVIGTDAAGCTASASTTVTISPAPIDASTSVSSTYSFCSQGPSSFSIPVNLTTSVTSMTWSYATTQAGPYTSFTSAQTVTGATLTPSSTGALNATLGVSGYSNGGYGGPRFFRLVIVGTSCTYNYNIQLFDTKGSGIAPAPTSAITSICNGDATTLTIGTLNAGYTQVQWQSSSDSSTWANVTTGTGGATGTYTTAGLTATTYYRVILTASGNCGYTTAGIKITVASAISANTITPSTSCTDGSTYITLTGSTITGGVFQWQRSTTSATTGFTDLIGATFSNYTLTRDVVPVSTWYRRIASTSVCAQNTSTAVAVYAPITNNVITNSTTSYCGTATATALTGSTPVGGDGTYVYSWQSSTDGTNFTTIGSAAGINYTTVSTSTTTYYKRTVTSGGCGSSTSAVFVVTVNANPTVSISPTSQSICSGSSVTLTASGASSYSWTGSDLSATTGTTVVSTPTQTRIYTVTGTDANGCSATSGSATITFVAAPANPTVSAGSQTICNGSSVNLTTKVTSGGTTEWYNAPQVNASYLIATPTSVSTAGTYYVYAKTGSCYSGATSYTLSITDVSKPSVSATSFTACSPATTDLTALQPASVSGVTYEWHTGNTSGSSTVASPTTVSTGNYFLFAYSSAGNCYGPASDQVTVTINTLPTATVSGTPAAVCYPNTINLDSYNTTGNGTYTYQWYSVATSPSPSTLVNLPGTVSTGGNYYLYATSAQGCMGAASSAVSVTINSKPTAVITSPSTVCAASVISIPGSTDAASPSYTWELTTNGTSYSTLSNTGIYSNTGTNTLGISSSTGLDGYQYRFTVTSGAGCSTTSDNAIVSVDAITTISTNPTDTTVLVNGTATFRVRTSGSPTVNYQWKVSTNGGSSYSDISDGAQYSGTTTSDLIVLNAGSGLNGYKYECQISNTCTSATLSSAATLGVNTCTVATVGGSVSGGTTVCSGSNAIQLTLSGHTGTILKWQSSSDNFSTVVNDINNTLTTYTPGNITATTSYRAVLQSGGCAGAYSSGTTLTVDAATIAGSVSGDAIKCSGTNSTSLSLSGNTGSIVKWQSSSASDFSAGVTDINNLTSSYSATNLSATTYYRVVVKSGVCAAANSSVATVTVYAAPAVTAEPTADTLIVTGNTFALSVTVNNTTGYQWSKDDADINGATSSSLSFGTITMNDDGVYKLRMTNTGCNVLSNAYRITPSKVVYSKSTGNFNIASNWGARTDGSGSTPVDFTRDEHTFVVANRASGNTGGNLSIAGTLDLKNGITVITPGTTLTAGVITRTGTSGTISGSTTSNLAVTGIQGATNSDLYFTRGADILKDLTVSNVTATLRDSLNITSGPTSGLVTLNNGAILKSDGLLTLKSGENGTASVAKVTALYTYIQGDVTVERYIPNNNNRGWRMLSIPTQTEQTIRESWQENQLADVDPHTGFGTLLTSNKSTWQADGYDEKTPGNSLLTYDQANDKLTGVPNTFQKIKTTGGYFVYIRGDRAIKQSYSTVAQNVTTLRTKGPLYTGTQTAITVPADKYAMIGNIYPSAIDVRNLNTTGGLQNATIYAWDPSLMGSFRIGAYQTLVYDEDQASYIVTPGNTGHYGPASSAYNKIESGQAFIIGATGTDGTLTFSEDAKITGSSSTVFNTVFSKKLISTLYYLTDTAKYLADGTLQLFDGRYDNAVNAKDAAKMYNFGENFYLTKNNNDLAAEKRNLLEANDTIFYGIANLARKTYQLEIAPENIDDNNLQAFLEDSYTKTSTPVSLGATTYYKFTIDANAASSVTNRLRIVFKANAVLATSFTSVKATEKEGKAVVEWNVTNQSGILRYEIEKSTNGNTFVLAGKQSSNGASTAAYQWTDNNVSGTGYYRIVSVETNGSKHYSQVVKLTIGSKASSLSVYPNPVRNGEMHLLLKGINKGDCNVRIINANGQLVLSKKFVNNYSAETIQIGSKIAAGNYTVELVQPDGAIITTNLAVVK